ncbi:PHP domain-containing protein [Hathewaya histolytica]|uniref:PHP domain-containing protein n=1 Tax=Hathewaya histolytica TaxID=1498 RepID=UPI003B6781BF
MYIKRYIFHVHTEYSQDSDMRIEKLYKKLKKNNIDGIAITDHNSIRGAIKFKEKYGKEIDVVIGEEVMTTNGEIIGLFLEEEIPKGLSPMETIKRIKEQDGIVYIPHPFDDKRKKTCLDEKFINELQDNIDVIEVFNGRCIQNSYNEKADCLARKLNKRGIVGSDAHSYYEVRFNHVEFRNKITRNNILEELKHFKILQKRNNKIIHYYTMYIKIKKLIKDGKLDEAFNFIYRGCKKRFKAFRKVYRK